MGCWIDCGAANCGDGLCADGETVGSCPADCSPCTNRCDGPGRVVFCDERGTPVSIECPQQFGSTCGPVSGGGFWCSCGSLAPAGQCFDHPIGSDGAECVGGALGLTDCPPGTDCVSDPEFGCLCDGAADGICPDGACTNDPDCANCTPQCGARTCGDNGCNGSCGSCGVNEVCGQDGRCFVPPPIVERLAFTVSGAVDREVLVSPMDPDSLGFECVSNSIAHSTRILIADDQSAFELVASDELPALCSSGATTKLDQIVFYDKETSPYRIYKWLNNSQTPLQLTCSATITGAKLHLSFAVSPLVSNATGGTVELAQGELTCAID